MVAEITTVETEVLPPEAKRMGRPTIRTEDNRKAILSLMAEDGLSFSRACDTIGLSKQSGSEWRAADSDFADAVARAEAAFLRLMVKELRKCKTKWKTPDPKALEILVRRFPEFRQHQEIETKNVSVHVSVNVAPEQLAGLQAMWAQSLEGSK